LAEELAYDITVGDGKYRLTYTKANMALVAYRHGVYWVAGTDALADMGVVLAMVQEVDDLQSKLHNLLAVIHRDGGHYTEKHGLEKSVQDAMQLSSERIAHSLNSVPIPEYLD